MLNVRSLLWSLLLTLPVGACDTLFGREISRLPVNAISTEGHEVLRETTLQLQKDESVALWSDMDMEYEGEAPVRFQVLILKNGAQFRQLEIDPTEKNVSVAEVKTSINGKTSWSFSGKNGEVSIPETAKYTFKARLVAASNPTLQIKKAELVLKQ
ncbi:hypothetical protein LGH70_04735 [Hymenobacter sp. BT635]|uniref:Intracellular proteinase inhibitor BsuPI domain-containing protein n=2 Tax=Hymenobacter nitidus TaxID=2880929 RepID=A0ABS8A9H4_9BACT|nr:hypothetical protein [Hymenobacter nitidus]